MTDKYKGRAIYNPSGKAGEYSSWAVNFYNGCSADCQYCYCKRGPLGSLWSTTPTLKKSLVNPMRAIEIFKHEVVNNLDELREHGLFFNFTSDPFLKETIDLNYDAMQFCNGMDIPVKALTKQTWWIHDYDLPDNVAIGYTLTGMDELEPGAASTEERIEAMDYFRFEGYKVWASVEPVVDMERAFEVIKTASPFVHHMKIGPLSGKKFTLSEVDSFIHKVNSYKNHDCSIYWKEGFVEKMGIIRNSLPANCVDRDYGWWG